MQQQQPWSPLWSLRRALYTLLLLLSEARQALISASPSAKATRTRMEIREQDFSFSDGTRERPVIEVVTKDVRTADIFNIMEAIRGDEEPPVEEAASWWKDAMTDEFSRQDVLVLALIAFCVGRLLIFIAQVTWRLARLPMRWYSGLKKEEDDEMRAEQKNESGEESSEIMKKQLASIRFCHLQFLLVVEKLKREMREDKNKDTQQLVASLAVSHHKEGQEVTLSEILMTLQKIQEIDASFRASEVEGHLANIKHDVEDEENIDDDLPEAWAQLQDVYASFLRIQSTIIRREQRRKTWQWQMQQHNLQYQEGGKEGPRRRKRRFPSSSGEDPTDEVLEELQELTKELPQGFTSDMFTSLGNAMHEKMVATEPETRPAPSPQMEIRPPRPSTAHTSAV